MIGADKGQQTLPPLSGSGLRIGIVQARFNAGVTDALLSACLTELAALGVVREAVTHITVPGALEIPLALQALARRDGPGAPDALIALGCVIRGETYHFELVSNESAAGITHVSLEHHTPVANAVLTVENLAQAQARQTEKGRDAARVAVEMARLLKQLAD